MAGNVRHRIADRSGPVLRVEIRWIDAWWLILRYFAEPMKSQQRITDMKSEIELTDEEKQLMEKYGISCETRPLYVF